MIPLYLSLFILHRRTVRRPAFNIELQIYGDAKAE